MRAPAFLARAVRRPILRSRPALESLWLRRWGLAAVTLAATLATFAALLESGHQQARREAGRRLVIVEAVLRAAVDRYGYLPTVLALDPDVGAFLADVEAPGRAAALDAKFKAIAEVSGITALYLLDRAGLTRSASNFDQPLSFVGISYAYRPYFAEAVATGASRYFGVGTTTNLPGLFIGKAIPAPEGGVAGVMVAKVDLEGLQVEGGRGGGGEPHRLPMLRPGLAREGLEVADDLGDPLRHLLHPFEVPGDGRRVAPLQEHRAAGEEGAQGRERLVDLVVDRRGDLPQSREPPRMDQLFPGRPQRGGRALPLRDLAAQAGIGRGEVVRPLRDALLQREAHGLLAAQALPPLARRREGEGEREAGNSGRERREQGLPQGRPGRGDVPERPAQIRQRDMGDEARHGAVSGRKAEGTGEVGRAAEEGMQVAVAVLAGGPDAGGVGRRQRPERAILPGGLARQEDDADMVRDENLLAGLTPLALHQARIRADGVAVTCAIPPDAFVRAEPVRLEQVLLNLMVNALDAMRDSAERRLDLTAVREREAVWRLCVADSGSGIAEEDMPHVFDPFFTTKEAGEGLGLGLSLSSLIVRDFGGSLSAANGARGAVLSLVLPAAETGAR